MNNIENIWEPTSLEQLIDIKHGWAFPGAGISEIPTKNVLVTPGSFKIGGGFKKNNKKFFTGTYPEEYLLNSGDLIVTMTDLSKTTDTLGFSALVPRDDKNYLHNQRIGLVKIKNDSVSKTFLYWLMRTYQYQRFIAGSASGTTVKHTSPTLIKKFSFNLPPRSIQKKIVSVLSVVDDKIELNTQINHNLEEQAKAIYATYFPYSINDALLEGWRKGCLGEIIELHDYKRIPLSGKERAKMEKNYPYYGAASLMDYVSDYLFDGIFLLFGEDGTVVTDNGLPVLQYVWGKFWVNNHAHVLTGKSGFSVESLLLLLKQTPVKSIITGAVQPKISQSNLKSLQIVIPPEKLLQEFNDAIAPLFASIRQNTEENKHLSQLRDTLLPKLMSGEIDVSEVDI